MLPLKGYGLMQPGEPNRRLSDAEMKHSNVNYLVLRDRWKYVHPAQGKIDLKLFEDQVKRCEKIKKPFVLGVMTGKDCSPDWLSVTEYNGCPVPWSLNILTHYQMLIERLSQRFHGHPLLLGVWTTGPTVPSQEMHTNGIERAPGFSADKMLTAWKEATDIVSMEFPDVYKFLSITGQRPTNAYRQQVMDHFAKVNGALSAFQHNSLGTQTSVNAVHHKSLLAMKKRGFKVGAEMVQPGHTAGISKFPQADFIVLYPGDQMKILPKR